MRVIVTCEELEQLGRQLVSLNLHETARLVRLYWLACRFNALTLRSVNGTTALENVLELPLNSRDVGRRATALAQKLVNGRPVDHQTKKEAAALMLYWSAVAADLVPSDGPTVEVTNDFISDWLTLYDIGIRTKLQTRALDWNCCGRNQVTHADDGVRRVVRCSCGYRWFWPSQAMTMPAP